MCAATGIRRPGGLSQVLIESKAQNRREFWLDGDLPGGRPPRAAKGPQRAGHKK